MDISKNETEKKASERSINTNSRITDKAVSNAERRAKEIDGDLLSPSDTLFNLLLDVADSYDTCPFSCIGFQCDNCWRSVLVVLAYKNHNFYEFVKDSDRYISHTLERGVDEYVRYG